MNTVLDDAAVLEADGIALEGGDRPGTDSVTARAYRHGVLDDRVVVRLVPGSVGEAEDLALEYLGFAVAAVPKTVGVGVRRAVGFPAWALVHDPANGRHALALVKEMERLARVAKSKPGNAKEGYDAVGARLGAAAPHFLPTFWEQAGRAFIASDNAKTAGICFGKAREAERVHALAIDEDRLGDVYLEYALAGAMPAKAISQYGRDLARRLPADVAYERMRLVALQRVAGGLPPHVGMAEDLSRLARAAKRDDTAAIVTELLDMPAVAKAPLGFWKSYRTAIVKLARSDQRIRAKLRAILPNPPGWRTVITEEWVELLVASGADAGLVGDDGDTEPPGTAAAWLGRITGAHADAWRAGRSPGLIALAGRMTAKLRAEGVPVDLGAGSRRADIDLDVLDVLLDAGVPVVRESINRLDVDDWFGDGNEGARDLVAIAAAPDLIEALGEGLRGVLYRRRNRSEDAAHDELLRRIIAVPGLRTVVAGWLAAAGAEASGGPRWTVIDMEDLRERLAPLHSPVGASVAPDAARELAGADVAAALARTLRAGFTAELGWPAFDEAVDRFAPDAALSFHTSWPYMVVSDEERAVVVGPAGVVAEMALHLPAKRPRYDWNPPAYAWVDGQLSVGWYEYGGYRAYWSDRPGEVFEREQHPSFRDALHLLTLPSGGVTTGDRAWHAGDREVPSVYRVAGDGRDYWRLSWAWIDGAHKPSWNEYDPATGAVGRASLPRFIADGGPDVRIEACELHPCDAPGSPLGTADGLAGWRVRDDGDGVKVGEGIDGRSVRLDPGGKPLVGALTLPGAAEPRALLLAKEGRGPGSLLVADPETGRPASDHTARAEMPRWFWHFATPRDEAGSAVLRAVTPADAAALIAAVPADADLAGTEPATPIIAVKRGKRGTRAVAATAADGTAAARHAAAVEAVARVLPGVTDARLRGTVARWAVRAADIVAWLAETAANADAEVAAPAVPVATVSDEHLDLATAGLREGGYYWRSSSASILPDIAAIGAALRGEIDALPGPSSRGGAEAIGAAGAVAFRAASPGFAAAVRAAGSALVTAYVDAGLVGRPGTLRVMTATTRPDAVAPGQVLRDGDRVTVILSEQGEHYDQNDEVDGVDHHILEYAPDGRFVAPPGAVVGEERRPRDTMDVDRLTATLRAAAERGPWPWRPESVDALAAASGATRAEAALILAGLPGVLTYGAKFLDEDVRAMLDLPTRDAKAARDSLAVLSAAQRVALLEAGLPANVDDLWTTGPDVAGIAAAWQGMFGRAPALDDDVLADLNRVTHGRQAVETARGAVNAAGCGWFNAAGLDGTRYTTLARILPWLAYRLPAGDPARAALPDAHARILAALPASDWKITLYIDGGAVALDAVEVIDHPGRDWKERRMHVSRLTGRSDPALAVYAEDREVHALRVLLGAGLEAIMAQVAAESAAEGPFWPQDPRRSVPDLVAAVAARYSLEPDAAAYHLMLLALPDPTDRHVSRWAGWTTREIKRLGTAVAAAGLAVEAKRERAGRAFFLPGGWTAHRTGPLPVEDWKHDLYVWSRDDNARVAAPLVPVPELFRRAWARVQDGDEPKLKQLRESR